MWAIAVLSGLVICISCDVLRNEYDYPGIGSHRTKPVVIYPEIRSNRTKSVSVYPEKQTKSVSVYPEIKSNKIKSDCVYPKKVQNQADYYWRVYSGVVPKDAVPGGYSRSGNVTYVAQVPSSLLILLAGNIYPGQREAVACPVTRLVEGKYVKILCSNPANKFEWISTTADNSHLLSGYHWVIGGAEGVITYIGRASFEGEVQVGRVFDSNSPYKGLWICNSAGVQVNFISFELLVLRR